MSSSEAIFFWLSALFVAFGFLGSLGSLVFSKPRFFRVARISVTLGFVSLSILEIIRWVTTGHPPFVTLFESMVASIWFTLLIFIILDRISDRFSVLTLPVSFITFLMIGWSSSLAQEGSALSTALDNVWLFIHASFATSGAASFLIAASFSILYLMGNEKLLSFEKMATRVPEFATLPKTVFNFVLFGLILWGIMIVSGSIWAHAAWGRYWAWDPIEMWSLISWLVYGLVVHTRLTFKISNRLFCRLTILAAVIVAFSLWGVGYIYKTIHSYG